MRCARIRAVSRLGSLPLSTGKDRSFFLLPFRGWKAEGIPSCPAFLSSYDLALCLSAEVPRTAAHSKCGSPRANLGSATKPKRGGCPGSGVIARRAKQGGSLALPCRLPFRLRPWDAQPQTWHAWAQRCGLGGESTKARRAGCWSRSRTTLLPAASPPEPGARGRE